MEKDRSNSLLDDMEENKNRYEELKNKIRQKNKDLEQENKEMREDMQKYMDEKKREIQPFSALQKYMVSLCKLSIERHRRPYRKVNEFLLILEVKFTVIVSLREHIESLESLMF